MNEQINWIKQKIEELLKTTKEQELKIHHLEEQLEELNREIFPLRRIGPLNTNIPPTIPPPDEYTIEKLKQQFEELKRLSTKQRPTDEKISKNT
jgi:hypothetical protein